MSESNAAVVLITVGSQEEARKVATALLEGRKAACVNIVPELESHFWWEGKLDTDQELLLIVKTRTSLMDELVSLVKSVHSYDVPEVIALPIIGGNQDYLDWLDKEVRQE
jgi:periplasmic divalent cation tolerance protein